MSCHAMPCPALPCRTIVVVDFHAGDVGGFDAVDAAKVAPLLADGGAQRLDGAPIEYGETRSEREGGDGGRDRK